MNNLATGLVDVDLEFNIKYEVNQLAWKIVFSTKD